jgi:DNA polymerase/3'-5' exonuclease PolX
MELQRAQKLAVSICEALQPFSQKINIAGDVRRQMRDIRQIEIVCTPKTQIYGQYDMFSEVEATYHTSDSFVTALRRFGKFKIGDGYGKRTVLAHPELMIDLHCPELDDYYRMYAVATGSPMYVIHTLRPAWEKQGWVATEDGLRKQKQCFKFKEGWFLMDKLDPNTVEYPPEWESEKQFFEWLSVPYIQPRLRTI